MVGDLKGPDNPKNMLRLNTYSPRTYSFSSIQFQIYSYGKEKSIFFGELAFSFDIVIKSQKNSFGKR